MLKKICLMGFVLVFLLICSNFVFASNLELYEYDNDGWTAGSHTAFGNYQRISQAFTVGTIGPNEQFIPKKVNLLLFKNTDPDMLIVSIRQVVGSGNETPIGSDLCWGQINVNDLTTNSSNPEWRNITLIECPSLDVSTQYALYMYTTTDSNSALGIKVENPAGYAGGNLAYSSDNGQTWSTQSYNAMFEIWGDSYTNEEYFENINVTQNLTVGDTGFFTNLGDVLSRIMKGWFISLDVSGNLSVGYEQVNNICYNSQECNVTCPSGKNILSGGCSAQYNIINSNYPLDNQWICDAAYPSTITAYAVCSRIF